jgi:dihydroxyacid dehydratase/phosphogluconate dehydratase
MIRVDLNTRRCDALVEEAEIARRLAEEACPPVPDSQTPWEELYREKTGQLAEGGVMEFALKYRGTAKKLPRHNH